MNTCINVMVMFDVNDEDSCLTMIQAAAKVQLIHSDTSPKLMLNSDDAANTITISCQSENDTGAGSYTTLFSFLFDILLKHLPISQSVSSLTEIENRCLHLLVHLKSPDLPLTKQHL